MTGRAPCPLVTSWLTQDLTTPPTLIQGWWGNVDTTVTFPTDSGNATFVNLNFHVLEFTIPPGHELDTSHVITVYDVGYVNPEPVVCVKEAHYYGRSLL